MESISVIVPFYNRVATLERCVQSILSQTYREFTLILVDDGSTDESLALAKHLSETDDRIVVVSKENGGAASARNRGIEEAKDPLVMFVDSDDTIPEHMLQEMVGAYELNKPDIVICGYEMIRGTNKTTVLPDIHKLNYTEIEVLELVCMPEFQCLLAPIFIKLFSLSLIKEHQIRFDTTVSTGEDVCFTLAYLRYAQSAHYLPKALYHYIDRPGSLAKMKNDAIWEGQLHLYEQFRQLFGTVGCLQQFSHAVDYYLLRCIKNTLEYTINRDWNKQKYTAIVEEIAVRPELPRLYQRRGNCDRLERGILFCFQHRQFFLLWLLYRGKHFIRTYFYEFYQRLH